MVLPATSGQSATLTLLPGGNKSHASVSSGCGTLMIPPVFPRMFLLVGSHSVSKQLGQALSGSVTQEMTGSAEDPPVPRKVNETGLAGSEAVLVDGAVVVREVVLRDGAVLVGTGLEL